MFIKTIYIICVSIKGINHRNMTALIFTAITWICFLNAQSLNITIDPSLNKSSYLTAEPIWFSVNVENNSPYKISMDTPFVMGNTLIFDKNGERWWFVLSSSLSKPDFGPGEKTTILYELTGNYGAEDSIIKRNHFPPGEYRVFIEFPPITRHPSFPDSTTAHVPTQFDKIRSGEVTFEVFAPYGFEKEAFEILQQAYEHDHRSSYVNKDRERALTIEAFESLINKFPGSVYAEQALHDESLVGYFTYDQASIMRSLQSLERFLTMFPESHYTDRVIGRSIQGYRKVHDQKSAILLLNEISKGYPNTRAGKRAQDMLDWLEEGPHKGWEFENE